MAKWFSTRGDRKPTGYTPGIFERIRGSASGTIKKGKVGRTVYPSVLRINIPLGKKKFVSSKRRKK